MKIFFTTCFFLLFTSILFAQSPGGLNPATVELTFWSKANTQILSNLVLNGNQVSEWGDENSTYSVTQSSQPWQPTFVNYNTPTGNFNHNPFIDFDKLATTRLLNGTSIASFPANAATVFIACNSNLTNGSSLGYKSGNNRIQFKCHWRVQNGTGGVGYVTDLIVPPSSGFMTNLFGDSSARIITMHGMGLNFNSRVNTQIFPMNLNATLYNPSVATGLSLGCNGTVEFVDDDMAEIIMYNTTLSLADVNKVETYLAIKYGSTFLTPQHYTLANNTTLWHNVNDLNYYHNLTGIGREDASGLYQKVSKSVNYKGILELYNSNVSSFPGMNDSINTTLADNAFMMFGDNDSSLVLNQCINNDYMVRLNRVWKVHTTPTFNGQATLRFKNADLPAGVKNLVVSNNPLFPNGNITTIPLTNTGTHSYASTTFTDNSYFTFASDSLHVNLTTTKAYCAGANGSATANVTGGVAPYTYAWSNSASNTSNQATGLSSGNYTTSITHGNNCMITSIFNISDSSILKISGTATNPLCFGGMGNVTLNAITGLSPVNYLCQNNGVNNSTGAFNNLSAGTYTFHIVDAAACIKDTIITISSPAQLNNNDIISPTCWNANTGSVDLLINGGAAPYQYSIDGNPSSTSFTYTGLKSGNHTVKITDNNGCILAYSFSIPTHPQFSVGSTLTKSTCANMSGASITLNVSNGSSPYSYNWLGQNNFTNQLNNIPAGLYAVTISDANQCSETHEFTPENDCCNAWFPTAFAINNNGINESYSPVYSAGLTDIDFKIFNRWGLLVYQSNSKAGRWDGNYKGRFAEIGTYFYYLKAKCNDQKKEYKGEFTLLR